jgi:hypothetical protein
MTGTEDVSEVDELTSSNQRVKDGLIISEYHFRNYEPLALY